MSRSWMRWAAVGALAVGPMSASAWDLSNTTTRAVLIQTEDTPCDNLNDYGAGALSNRFCLADDYAGDRGSVPGGVALCCDRAATNSVCTGMGTSAYGASDCCTGPGVGSCSEYGPPAAGTCNGDDLLPPDFAGAAAGCTTFAGVGADFTDTEGSSDGTADFYGTLTSTGAGTWNLSVPANVYTPIVSQTLLESGAALVQNAECAGPSDPHPCCTGAGTGTCNLLPLSMDVDTGTGAVSAPTPSPAPSPGGTFQYWRANALFPEVPIILIGEANALDAPYFGSSWMNSDPAGPALGGGAFESQCSGAGSPSACCDNFLADTGPPACPAPTRTGVPLTLSCAAAVNLPTNFAFFGPGVPLSGPADINDAICNPPDGLAFPGDTAGTNFMSQPGQSQGVGGDSSSTYITAFTISRAFAPTIETGLNATTPAFAAQDFRVVETTDTDGDLVPDAFDNCDDVPNADQADIGGLGAASAPDGIGDACQCGDVNDDGYVTTGDATQLQRALLTPPMQCGATSGAGDCAGGFKCDVNNTGTCSSGDATIIARALLTPPTASIHPGCGPAAIAP